MKNPQIIVAHPGRQHSFRVAKALKDGGMLYKYVTTVYNKKSSLPMRFVKLFLNKDNYDRATRRRCNGLHDDDVLQLCEIEGLLLLAIRRIDFTRRLSNIFDKYLTNKFQRKLAAYIIQQGDVDAVISYDTNSATLFTILKEKAPNVKLIMDNAHPNRHFLYHDYHKHWNAVGEFSDTLKACGYIMNKHKAEHYGIEACMAQFHLVASSYSCKALEFEGIDRNSIFKVPYGVDENRFLESQRHYSCNKLHVLFVGEVNQRKGIRQILLAAERIHTSKVEFHIIGEGMEHCSYLYSKYEKFVHFMGRVTLEELHKQFSQSSIFLFPTMGEGFGLVLLEAMAAGLPVIATPNCAAHDLITEGENGFIVPVGDVDAIVDKINWCLLHPQELKEMSRRAVCTARKYTWSAYETGIRSAVLNICEGENSHLSSNE